MLSMIVLSLASCRGPQGPMGPQGPQGPMGLQGPQGPQGSASITSYDITINATDWTPAYADGQTNPDFFYYDIQDRNLTTLVAEKGIVMVYLYTEDYVQTPLPSFDYGLDEGKQFETSFRFDFYNPDEAAGEVGVIRIYYMKSDFTLGTQMEDGHTFRVVLLWP